MACDKFYKLLINAQPKLGFKLRDHLAPGNVILSYANVDPGVRQKRSQKRSTLPWGVSVCGVAGSQGRATNPTPTVSPESSTEAPWTRNVLQLQLAPAQPGTLTRFQSRRGDARTHLSRPSPGNARAKPEAALPPEEGARTRPPPGFQSLLKIKE